MKKARKYEGAPFSTDSAPASTGKSGAWFVVLLLAIASCLYGAVGERARLLLDSWSVGPQSAKPPPGASHARKTRHFGARPRRVSPSHAKSNLDAAPEDPPALATAKQDGSARHLGVGKPVPQVKENDEAGAYEMAVIIDDIGYSETAADPFLELEVPITFAILPEHPISAKTANRLHRLGYETLLHVPLESAVADAPEEEGTLAVKMRRETALKRFREQLETTPGVIGVNVHQGSAATRDRELMNALIGEVKSQGLLFVDSLTAEDSVASEVAGQMGVPFAVRDVFLDNSVDADALRGQLRVAMRLAERRSHAIAIGHPHQETAAALKRALPELTRRRIALVSVSAIVAGRSSKE